MTERNKKWHLIYIILKVIWIDLDGGEYPLLTAFTIILGPVHTNVIWYQVVQENLPALASYRQLNELWLLTELRA